MAGTSLSLSRTQTQRLHSHHDKHFKAALLLLVSTNARPIVHHIDRDGQEEMGLGILARQDFVFFSDLSVYAFDRGRELSNGHSMIGRRCPPLFPAKTE